jgi:hypothetical protein
MDIIFKSPGMKEVGWKEYKFQESGGEVRLKTPPNVDELGF